MLKSAITMVGSGRVAEHLALSLHKAGFHISEVISRNADTAGKLAARVNARTGDLWGISSDSRLVILAVPDDVIHDLSRELVCPAQTVVVHTSGSTPIGVFPPSLTHTGVIYPLQTFTKGRSVSLEEVHFFTEASDDETHMFIDSVVSSLSPNIHHITSGERRVLHLVAVFVSNFVNHMLSSGEGIARREAIDFRYFAPLILETVKKALDMGAAESQTGPAVRNDTNTIQRHLDMLAYSDELRSLYLSISESIIKQYTSE